MKGRFKGLDLSFAVCHKTDEIKGSLLLGSTCSGMFFGWPSAGTLVIPGRSMRVRSGMLSASTSRVIKLSLMPFLSPASVF